MALISRDERAYSLYKDYFPKAHNGIDCGFFLAEAFKPCRLKTEEFVIFSFDSMKEPKIEEKRRIIRVHHKCMGKLSRKWFVHKDTLISDIPDDYFHLYANASAVYTDRVHACIAALSFDKYARIYSNSPRAVLFERVGGGEIWQKLVRIDQKQLEIEKANQISILRDIFQAVKKIY
jgi:hypothetical protein